MIDEIQVKDVALIREASLSPSPGLTVLTGETGAGKTALVSAVKLLVGERADSSYVREGAKNAEVRGRLFPSDPTADELVAVRKVSADGRSRATINGTMASVSELARTVGPLVELCGQHEYQSLLKPAEHGRILDGWADLESTVGAAFREALANARAAEAALEEMRATASASNTQLEEARFTLQQIEAVNPEGGEYEETRDWLARAEHAEVLARNSHGAAEALSGDGGALDALNTAISLIEEASRADESLAPFATTLRETCFVVEDVARDMAAYCDAIDFDGESLAAAQERMGQLMGLMRSFGPTMEAVFERWDAAAALVGLVDDADENLARAEAALEAAESVLAEAAAVYDAARAEAAPQFAAAVNEVLGRLEMGTAALVCTVEPLPRENWSAAGSASVVFEFKPGASMQPRPFARIASGGEISRVMLAVKAALGEADGVDTLVFDEVDAGIGGKAALAVAAVLRRLARTHQVICVTHLPQIAVAGDTHYLVQKEADSDDGVPSTSLQRLSGDNRVDEIARMLSGEITEASRSHAAQLLSQSASETKA